MGKVQFCCQNCQTERELDERWLGLQTVCLGCGKSVTVQPVKDDSASTSFPVDTPDRLPQAMQGGDAEEPASDADGKHDADERGPLRLASAGKKVHFNCPDCGRHYSFNEASVGMTVKCYRCGTRLLIVNVDGEIEKVVEAEPTEEEPSRKPQTATEWLKAPLSQIGSALKRRYTAARKDPSAPETDDVPDASTDNTPPDGDTD